MSSYCTFTRATGLLPSPESERAILASAGTAYPSASAKPNTLFALSNKNVTQHIESIKAINTFFMGKNLPKIIKLKDRTDPAWSQAVTLCRHKVSWSLRRAR